MTRSPLRLAGFFAFSFAISLAARGQTVTEHLRLGNSAVRQGELTIAITQFREALKLEPDNVAATIKLAETVRQAGEFEVAQDALESRLKRPASSEERQLLGETLADMHFWWGKDSFANERYDEALTHFRAALQFDEQHRRKDAGVDLSEIGSSLNLLDREDEALVHYERALPLLAEFHNQESAATTHGHAGDICRNLDRYDEALRHYQRQIELLRALKDPEAEALTLAKIGSVNYSLERFEVAIQSFESAKKIFQQQEDRENEATMLHNIGDSLRELNRLELAANAFAACLAIRRDLKDQAEEALMLAKLGSVSEKLGRFEQALEQYELARAIFQERKDRADEASMRIKLGECSFALSRYETAKEHYEEALVILAETKDRSDEATVFNNLGALFDAWRRFDTALEYYLKALPVFQESTNRRMESVVLNNIGAVFEESGRHEEALKYFQQALPIDVELRNQRSEAKTLNNMGATLTSLSQYETALQMYERALPILLQVQDRVTAATTLNNIGEVLRELNRHREALGYYARSLDIEKEVGNRNGEAITLNNIGLSLRGLGKAEEALEHYQLALPILREVKDRKTEASTLNNIANLHGDAGRKDQAQLLLRQSLAISLEIGDRNCAATTLNNLGLIHDSSGQGSAARECLQQALGLAREAGDLSLEAKTLHNLMLQDSLEKNPRLAIYYGKRAVNVIQQIRGNIRGLEQNVQRDFLTAKEKTYRALAELLIGQGRLPEAEQVLHLLKQQEYFEFVRRDGGESPLLNGRAELTPAETGWEQRYLEISDRVTALGPERGELLAKATLNAADQKRLAVLDKDLETANRAFRGEIDRIEEEAGSSKLKKDELHDLREAQGLMETLGELGSGAVALYTLVGEAKYRVVLITPEVQIAREYAISAADLNRKVQAFREVLRDPHRDVLPLAQELYQILVAPVAKDLPGAKAQTLMWSLDGVLRYVPMAALHDGKQYLVEQYRNAVFTPASESRLKDAVSPEWRALGLGVSKAHQDFPALPGVAAELRSIIRREEMPGNAVLSGAVRMDEDFTAEVMFSALRQKYPLVHIASHFQFRPGNETDSFLLLGDGSHLTLDRIKNLPKIFGGVELLTLSACDTETGGAGADGKEVEGFGVLAQRQGAKAVLASLWPVSDASTQRLMQEFYRLRQAKAGTLKAEALRQSQLALLRGESGLNNPERGARLDAEAVASQQSPVKLKFSHPYYWSPFILIGNWR